MIHGRWAFHDRGAHCFPRLRWLRKNFCRTDFARRCQRRDAERLQFVGHARIDEKIAPFAEAHNAAVDAPGVC